MSPYDEIYQLLGNLVVVMAELLYKLACLWCL